MGYLRSILAVNGLGAIVASGLVRDLGEGREYEERDNDAEK